MARARRRLLALGVVALALAADVAAAAGDVPPRRRRALLAWLAGGTYREAFTPEALEAHPSAGPHGGRVLTYYNPILVEDLRAGRTVFRKKAAMVKELYFGGTEVGGWAVMVKVRRRSGGAGTGWFFYETFDPTGRDTISGRGHRMCAPCHAEGLDFLRSDFRP
jgi:hypothetical protein